MVSKIRRGTVVILPEAEKTFFIIPSHMGKGIEKTKIKKRKNTGPWWITFVILATEEAEVRRIEASPGQIICETPPQKNCHKKSAARVAQTVKTPI
jgi:hypothetical protein